MDYYLNYCLDANAKVPDRAHCLDAGLDLFINKFTKHSKDFLILNSGETCLLDTGVHVDIPAKYAGFILPRSSISALGLLTHTGVIDSGYTGSIKVIITNLSSKSVTLHIGQKIAQLVVQPILLTGLFRVPELANTERGSGSFGSTGN